MTNGIPITVGICAYNEENNIARALDSVLDQELSGFVLDSIIVSSSACTDRTDDIVREHTEKNPLIKLVVQTERRGKNVALNDVLDNMNTEIVVMFNADNIMAEKYSLQKIVEPFLDPKVGIVGGHPIPVNDTKSVAGYASRFMWSMHHFISMKTPKIGEYIAFRDTGYRLPTDTQSDEDWIKLNLMNQGYELAYAPEATTHMRGPDTEADFIKQRTRCNIGQIYMIRDCNLYFPTRNTKLMIGPFIRAAFDVGVRPIKILKTVKMEKTARKAAEDYVAKGNKDMSAWSPVESTKKL